MTSISIYDIEAEKLENICEELDTTEAEVIEALLNAVDAGDIRIKDYI